ncbi:hypothetical protein SADUNF_Sadunf07G0092000 [Salix dunnii]|uniref:LysM domain-containing protein n=1 Tax=Salix dunnii TaxID=1413687 RepID=A0A835K5S1_9ROSI|nr:hypothetical protein SADUNF_Sadunf07G0092000 [Salix dunnii]
MAQGNRISGFVLSSILVLSFLLVISMAESRILGTADLFAESTPECDEVVGVASGDTCFDVAKTFNLTAASFDAINPNLNCNALFVGQWLCVAGSV